METAMPRKKTTLCPHCQKREIRWRGVCIACFSLAKYRIKTGKATDAQLVQLGWWRAPLKTGRPSKGGEAMKRILGK